MQRALALAFVVLQCCDICATIRVPVVWDSDSEVTDSFADEQPKTSADRVKSQNIQQPVPVEYFEYTANKPQFAVDIAKFHGVQSPEDHYKARPILPYTGKTKPELGRHRLQDQKRPVFKEFQEYVNKDTENDSSLKPALTNYEVFHPYKAEEPGFQGLYKDPVLDKIRNDIRDSSQRLQTYEHEAGKPNIESGEYLEEINETERKKFPQRNIPAPYEIHRPHRRPIYYKPSPRYPNRDQILNKRFRHPWNQNYAKIRPVHYVPLQNHIHRLRQNHALKYDDERNEYPQVPLQHYEDPSDGYDIYEQGKAKFVQLRNNLDESVNDVIKESRPSAPQKLELQADEQSEPDEEDEFVPVKNYAQVRKTETTKHLPKSAAFDDAESYEEIRNAPRLREAVKSTKAQTVYSEEGYEDSAYDHAGEQKHASDHEGHAGYLKENEFSGGKYKTPSVSGSYEDGKGTAYRDQIQHGEQWNDNNKDSQKEEESEDYSEDEHEKYVEADSYHHGPNKREDNQRKKREDESESIEESTNDEYSNPDNFPNKKEISNTTVQHDVNKRETNTFKVPGIDLDTVFLNEKDILEIAKEKIVAKDNLKEKYPYYYKNLKTVNEHSPLRYAENLKFIPKKSKGGTEFYDSRSHLECPEVDDKVDAIPDKLKKNGHPDDDEGNDAKSDKTGQNKEDSAETARLSGLGDKIDCFKAKYFGENPLDSPFFKEDIISNPKPITLPKTLAAFEFKTTPKTPLLDAASSNIFMNAETLRNESRGDIFELLNKLNDNKNKFVDSVVKDREELKALVMPQNITSKNESLNTHQHNVFSDILQNIKSNSNLQNLSISEVQSNLKNKFIKPTDEKNNKEKLDISQTQTRVKRSAPFVYEPYKIIRDVQVPESKKTTTSSNISPLIKQLQSSKVIDAVVKEQPVKRTIGGRTYKDIGKKDREKHIRTDVTETGFVDVNEDKRRGEPRFELRHLNHKSQYSPITPKKSMSIDDYEAQTKLHDNSNVNDKLEEIEKPKPKRPAPRAVYDISKFLPKISEEIQNPAASNTVKTTILTSPAPTTRLIKEETTTPEHSDVSDEEYDDEYDDETKDVEDEFTPTTSTTTTTTAKPIFRRRIRLTTTTEKVGALVTETPPKLRLITRFNTPPSDKITQTSERPHKPQKKYEENDEVPKYREKKKKSTKSTLVTDTKMYGSDDDDDMRKDEIDALIGIKQDMDEYTPTYEKDAERSNKRKYTDSSEEADSSEEEDDEEEEGEDDGEEDEDEDYDDVDAEEEDAVSTPNVVATTTESSKRTLARTTDAPPSTTESRSAKLQIKPVISKKKIEIHKESPVNKSSPHITQYKQDIEEEEIIKELPRKIPEAKENKNVELLDFYKDENLAKDINKLGGVEVFKENLDLRNGPRHGGNYRRAPDLKEDLQITKNPTSRRKPLKPPKDAVTSQTENKRRIELDDHIPARRLHGGNLKSINDFKRNQKSEKILELTTDNIKAMHGGNLKSVQDRGSKRFSGRNAKLIELDDSSDADDDDDTTSPMHGGNFKSSGFRGSGRGTRLHGGNYRNAKIIATDNDNDDTKSLAEITKVDNPNNAGVDAAILLNSFAQAAPILTTTPAYILDPSKRMYYYVDK